MPRMRIKNWEKFQHYKDRRPSWIKLYRDILDDHEWHQLSGNAAKYLVMMWLLASEADGYLPDINTLAFRLRVSSDDVERVVSELRHYIDITTLADCYQSDSLEKRREETEKSREEGDGARSALASRYPLSFKKLSDIVGGPVIAIGIIGSFSKKGISDKMASTALDAYAAKPSDKRQYYSLANAEKAAESIIKIHAENGGSVEGGNQYEVDEEIGL